MGGWGRPTCQLCTSVWWWLRRKHGRAYYMATEEQRVEIEKQVALRARAVFAEFMAEFMGDEVPTDRLSLPLRSPGPLFDRR